MRRPGLAQGLAAAGLSLLLFGAPTLASPAEVRTAVAKTAPAGAAGQLNATLQPIRQATLAAQIGGAVLALNVKAGDRLAAGQVVARIDERDAQAALLQADAAIAQADASARQARLQLDRTQALKQQGFISQSALDQADHQAKSAQAALNQAKAARQQAALSRGFATVLAPYDAVVLATHAEPGDLASPGRPMATVYVPGAVRAVVQVPASMTAQLREASQVQVLLPDGRRLVPQRRQWLPVADAVSQTVEWRLDLPEQPAESPLRPGQAVQVVWQSAGAPAPASAGAVMLPPASAGAAALPPAPAGAAALPPAPAGATALPPAPAGALVIPPAALLQRGELTAVYVAQGQRFVLRAVRAGARRGDGVEVLAGLKVGERYALDAVAAGLDGARPAP